MRFYNFADHTKQLHYLQLANKMPVSMTSVSQLIRPLMQMFHKRSLFMHFGLFVSAKCIMATPRLCACIYVCLCVSTCRISLTLQRAEVLSLKCSSSFLNICFHKIALQNALL